MLRGVDGMDLWWWEKWGEYVAHSDVSSFLFTICRWEYKVRCHSRTECHIALYEESLSLEWNILSLALVPVGLIFVHLNNVLVGILQRNSIKLIGSFVCTWTRAHRCYKVLVYTVTEAEVRPSTCRLETQETHYYILVWVWSQETWWPSTKTST